MSQTLRHRGPDDMGCATDVELQVGLGHTRLEILGLGPAGAQPMSSPDGAKVLDYNGELYNYAELRARLTTEGVRFAGTSDTEVLLWCLARWGVERTLAEANGMFAFALLDRDRRSLVLARDRLGEKPLYYGHVGEVFAFGSELRALRVLPGFTGDISPEALSAYIRLGVVPAPLSIHPGIAKLAPGAMLELSLPWNGSIPAPTAYWNAESLLGSTTWDSPHDDELERVLADSVGLRMSADVPVGAFLSAGVDSSLVVALMQRASTTPVRTFTASFPNAAYDESAGAAAIAAHLGTDHHTLPLSFNDVRRDAPLLAEVFDEPFADSSQLPTLLIARQARTAVKVVLTGDGADELFGGYDRYRLHARWGHWLRLPWAMRRALAMGIEGASEQRIEALAHLVPGLRHLRRPGQKAHRFATWLAGADPADAYERLQGTTPAARGDWQREQTPHAGPLHPIDPSWPLFRDLVTYLPDDLLVKVDRATMAVGLEARLPMLDPAVAEFAWRLPISDRVGDSSGKLALRRVLARYVPPSLTGGPKTGFGVPLGAWLRGPLRPWAEELLAAGQGSGDGLWDHDAAVQLWQEHLRGPVDRSAQLWTVLMLAAWRDRW